MSEKFALVDRMKIGTLLKLRSVNRNAIENWSRSSFRYPRTLNSPMPQLEPASVHFKSDILPPSWMVATELPREAKLKKSYLAGYYYIAGVIGKYLSRFPLGRTAEWSAEESQKYPFFKTHDEGWNNIQTDEAFTALRLQGPCPFLLNKTGADTFEVDYEPYCNGAFDPVCCTFTLDHGTLRPTSIRVNQKVYRPGEQGWEQAKFAANSMELRFTVFARHLAHTHLITGQSFSLSAYALPAAHPLRAFLDFFTYSTLTVNDFAFQLLVTPASFFLQSQFIAPEQVGRLFTNMVANYRLEQLMPPRDIAQRGIDAIPGHPYVEDSMDVWNAITHFVQAFVKATYATDKAVRDDAALVEWYKQLVTLLPDRSPETHKLEGLTTLVETLSALVYLNVSHEVCGDYAPYIMDHTTDGRKIIHRDSLTFGHDAPPRAADVFLIEQGAWIGRWEIAGNVLLDLDPDKVIEDPGFRKALRGFQSALRTLESGLVERNKKRKIPFHRMLPHRWQASISF